mmetsp:Transcript_12579/g.36640  ORF Transcript_12579/g.36640 Transcript_12579/m.36640 type:complete len:214 (+) Transcript_12579:77-718(+)|eukprot:CAMPEP_0119558614 /NCGR_PEP_ID=MMETSP1352-20130426/10899_1 /TAXON_ID=265584 /ORGANISM="Stauroneis constricta, Strain CCMP1120" /LENGTH=213 /DNA_ID=CAMNT_0007606019 /DNA_START=85 /DNA_END=726 /DNA_ORIENTATION=-
MVAMTRDPLLHAVMEHDQQMMQQNMMMTNKASLEEDKNEKNHTQYRTMGRANTPPCIAHHHDNNTASPSSVPSATDDLMMTMMMESSGSSPSTPTYPRDKVFTSWAKTHLSPRRTQILEDYRDFRMGQGDPLMQEIMHSHQKQYHHMRRHSAGKALPEVPFCEDDDDDENDISDMIHQGPVASSFLNDVVHIGTEVVSFPILPSSEKGDEGNE